MRRYILAMTAALAGLFCAPAMAQSEPPRGLVERAAAQGRVVWYETTPQDQIAPVIKAFEARFPGVKLNHVYMPTFEGIGPRLIQEAQARLPTADVVTTGGDLVRTLSEKGILSTHDWKAEIGLAPPAAETNYAVAQVASVFVVLSNSRLVSDADVPKSWNDLTSERWKGKMALWSNGYPFALLAQQMGEEAANGFVAKIAAQKPLLFPTTQAVTQAIVSGDLPIGIGLIHTSRGAINQGAPVRMTPLEPTPVAMNYSAIVKGGSNAEGGKLLIWWLASDEGGKAIEAASFRGNIYAATDAAKLITGRTVATWPIAQADAISRLVPRYTATLRGQ